MALIIALGDPVIINVLVLSPGSILIPTGVTILRDGHHTVAITRLDNNGQSVFNIPSTTFGAGVHEITVYYAGDENFAPALSDVLEVDIVTLTGSVTTITPSSTNVTYGTSITFNSNVSGSGGTLTGTVNFLDGIVQIDSQTLVSGSVTSIPVILTGGSHAVIASYTGDTQFAGSNSFPAIITVSKYTPAISIISSHNPSNHGDSVMFSSALTVPAGTTATGTISFLDGAVVIGSSLVSFNSASFSLSTLTGGNHSITAQYTDDTNFNSVTSSILTQTVNALATSTTLSSSVNPTTYGQFTLLSAQVNAASGVPTGTITFKDGASIIGTVPLDGSGLATMNIGLLSAASHSLTAAYSGDSNYATSVSNTINQVVNAVNTTTALTPIGPINSPAGVNITFTATVSSAFFGTIPTGNVQFKDGGSNLSLVALNGSGVAQFTTAALSQGAHSIIAVYITDGNHNASTSNAVSVSIVGQASATNLSSSNNPSSFGSSVTFTASVTGSFGIPVGTVQFMDGGSPISSSIGLDGSGNAQFSTSSLTTSVHNMTAVYTPGGGSPYAGSTSNTVFQVVNKLTPTFTITSSNNPLVFGNSVIFTAHTSGASGSPTGSIQFIIDSVNFGAPVLLSGGTASISTSTLVVGSHTVTGTYTGDGTYNNASATLVGNPEVVTKVGTTTTISSSINPTTFGAATVFSSTVSSLTTGTPTGTVQFKDGGSNIGSPVTLISGNASLSYSALSTGSHSITSVYSGDSNFNTSTSSTLTQTVNLANTSTILISSNNPTTYGQSTTFTATVLGGSPTGTITFKNGGTTIGTATLPTNSLAYPALSGASSPHSITAVYSGDSNNAGSTSNTISQAINKASTSVQSFFATGQQTTVGQFTLSATVVPQFVNVAGVSEPSGNVQFTVVSPFSTLPGSPVALNGSNPDLAVLSNTSITTAGTYQLQATYVGDSNFTGSSQFINSFVISKLTPSLTMTSFSPNNTGGFPNTVVGITLSGDGVHHATGTVTMKIDGVTTALTGTLGPSGGVDITQIAIPSTAWNGGGLAQQGNHTVQVVYGGDNNFNAVSSSTVNFLYIEAAPTITTTLNPTSVSGVAPDPNRDSILTISVTGPYGSASGLVNIYATSSFLSTTQLNTTPITLDGFGNATVTISPNNKPGAENASTMYTDAATHHGDTFTITASNNGDTTYHSAVGGSGTLNIQHP